MTMLKKAHSPIEIDSTLTMTNVEDPRPSMRYELTVRNKFIGVGDQPPALRKMANALRAQAEFFEALDDPRIEYYPWENDYHFSTPMMRRSQRSLVFPKTLRKTRLAEIERMTTT